MALVQAHFGLGACLKALQADEPQVDRTALADLIRVAVSGALCSQAEKSSFEVADLGEVEITAFRTAKPDRIAIDYTLTAGLVDRSSVSTTPREDAHGIVHGSCYWLPDERAIEQNHLQRVALRFKSGLNAWSPREYDRAFPIPRPIEHEERA